MGFAGFSLVWLAFGVLAHATQSPAPESPLWPEAFSINMTEQLNGKGATTPVSYYYDSSQKAEKWVRHTTGKLAQDNVCQGVDAPCTDLVTQGNRWIIHPTLGDCCLLGTSAHGCGPLARDWIVRNKGTYAGRAVVEGVETDEWDTKGFAVNKFYQTPPPNSVPVKLDQGNDVNVYDRSSFIESPGGLHPDVFALPSSCSESKKCKSQFPCSMGGRWELGRSDGSVARDLQRAKTKVPRQSRRGTHFADMSDKLNVFLHKYKNWKECREWTVDELQRFQLQVLALRAPELDAVYQETNDLRKLLGDADVYMKHWKALRNTSSEMRRDGHCHEAVMWFTHHVSEPLRQKVALATPVPTLPRSVHACPTAASQEQRSVCDEYLRQVSCQQCHGDPKSVVV